MQLRFLKLCCLLLALCGSVHAQEICDNAADDDGDGLIDYNDTEDCVCTGDMRPNQFLLPNPSFEASECCPDGPTQMYCMEDWLQATNATSDYFNTCDYICPAVLDSGLLPFPDGNGIVGTLFLTDWHECVATCLLQPLTPGKLYRLTFSVAYVPINNDGTSCVPDEKMIPVNIALYGSKFCNSLPLSTSGCPTEGSRPVWVQLGQTAYVPASVWSAVSIQFVAAADFEAVMLGASCDLPASFDSDLRCMPYFVFDNLIMDEGTSCVCNIAMPDAFSPNKDNVNDLYTAFSECDDKLKSIDFKIFNRWGEVVYHANTLQGGWDGFYKGKESELGVYTYLITYSENGTARKLSGNLTLIR